MGAERSSTAPPRYHEEHIGSVAELKKTRRRYLVMARFYFHLFNDVTSIDEEGAELASEEVAMQRAKVTAREMAAQSVREGHLVLSHRIEVGNELGGKIATVHFGDVVQVRD